jgi:serine/threonine protein kinase
VKVISKYKVLTSSQQQHLFNEIKYMAQLKHPFLVPMLGVHQDSRLVYILMEYAAPGELMQLLKDQEKFDAASARFYSAQIVLAFEYLHKSNLIYRDLKPENILLQPNGFIKLTDFGFIKKIKPWERTYTLCGTPEYMAPEVIMNTGHGAPADWYTLGIFIYEMLVGRPPFMHNDVYEIF